MSFFRRRKEKKPSDLPVKPSSTVIKRSPSQRSTPSPLTQNGDIEGPLIPAVEFGLADKPVKLVVEEEDFDPGDLGNYNKTQNSTWSTSSRLSKSLEEVLKDKDALSCLIHFMDSRKAGALIRFCCDADSFQAATWSRIRTHSLNITRQSTFSGRGRQQTEAKSVDDTSNIIQKDNADSSSISSSQTLSEETASPHVLPEEELSLQHSPNSPSAIVNNIVQNRSGSAQKTDNSSSETPSVIPIPTTSNPSYLQTDIQTSTRDSSTTCFVSPVDVKISPQESDSPGAESSVPRPDAESSVPHPGAESSVPRPGAESSVPRPGAESSVPRPGAESSVHRPDAESSVIPPKPSRSKSVTVADLAEKLKRSIERDAVTIFQKYLSHDASSPVGISDQLRNECIRKICREDGEVDPHCFNECQTYIINKINLEYFSEFLSSEFHYRHQINVLTGSIVCLNDILYNEGSIFYFMEYMEQEGGSNLLQFLLAVDNFHKHLISLGEGYDGAEAQTDAMVIYDKYFSLQASHPLGFDDKIRFDVECNICREEGPLPDCFLKPRSIVLRTMEKMYFPGFLQSDIYYKYLSELVSTVQIASDLPVKSKHRRQDSDASSVHSSHSASSENVSHKNTLLARDTSHLRKGLQKLHASDINIDPGLLNPENLWKRNDASMSLGKVDSLGRFVSEFTPHPDLEKSKGSGIFKKKKKKEKDEEEMALKIAQMIISDVTSVTQAIGAMKNSEPEMEGDGEKS